MIPARKSFIPTNNIKLISKTVEQVHAMLAAMGPAEKKQLSADWLVRFRAAPSADPWTHGFNIVHRENDIVVGHAGFIAPPTANGTAEIAYGVNPEHRGKGYATEAAQALVDYAFESGHVRVVCAHTLPEPNASTRILSKCGFRNQGEVVHPEDGLVWRWEKTIRQIWTT
jgi:RimJ/RimL family protein N-acetyltransferase